jgi:hypothetical protein
MSKPTSPLPPGSWAGDKSRQRNETHGWRDSGRLVSAGPRLGTTTRQQRRDGGPNRRGAAARMDSIHATHIRGGGTAAGDTTLPCLFRDGLVTLLLQAWA